MSDSDAVLPVRQTASLATPASAALSAVEDAPLSRVAFGVGCWEFGIRSDVPFAYTAKEYVERLKTRLQRIPTINNVEVAVDEEAAYEVHSEYLRHTPGGTAFFPLEDLLWVKFDLYLPFRIQAELTNGRATHATGTEHFRVHVHYPYDHPVAFVELIAERASASPSKAVQVVREYLQREINGVSGEIVFQFVGPSPFHADFFLEEVKEHKADDDVLFFDCETLHLPGYADVTFRYTAADFATRSEAFDFLFQELADELGLFYEIARRNGDRYEDWSAIEGILSSVTEESPSEAWWRRLASTRERGQQIASLHASLARFEAAQLLEKHSVEMRYRHVYERATQRFLRSFLDAKIQDRPVFATQQTGALVQFIEERRSKGMELLFVLIASLIGGVAGSLITLISN